MDNNNNSNANYIAGDDEFFQNLMEADELYYVSREELIAQQQQNDPFVIGQGNVPFQDQFMEGNDNDNNFLPIGGGVPNVDVEGPLLMPQGQGQFFMHGNNNNFFDGGGVGNVEPGPFPEESQTHPENGYLDAQNDQDVRPLSPWPPPPQPFSCSCCQVLRQINHTNGFRFDKLEIHGTVGVINHAICHVKDNTPDRPPSDTYQMIEFCHRSTEEIRSFLKYYCKERIESGFIPIEDPSLSAFYDALCTGLDWTEYPNDEDDDLRPPNGMEQESESEPENENGGSTSTSKPKRNMAVQRQRVALMTLNDLSGVFHMTMVAAGTELEISVSALKKVCRKGGLYRWPQRKVTSIVKKVNVLKRKLTSKDPTVVQRTREEIQRLQQEMIEDCNGIVPTGIEILQF